MRKTVGSVSRAVTVARPLFVKLRHVLASGRCLGPFFPAVHQLSNGSRYTFCLPECVQGEGIPAEVECRFSEKAIMACKAALFRDAEMFEAAGERAKPTEQHPHMYTPPETPMVWRPPLCAGASVRPCLLPLQASGIRPGVENTFGTTTTQ